MENDQINNKIKDEINKLQNALSEYEECSKIFAKQKRILSKYATQLQNKRIEYERSSMFLEEQFAKMPSYLLKYVKRANPLISKKDALFQLQKLSQQYQQIKLNKLESEKVQNNINEMISQMQIQQKQLEKEEEIINNLRSREIQYKKENDAQYNSIMKKLHQKSDQFQSLRQENKAKKIVLLQEQQKAKEIENSLLSKKEYVSKLQSDIKNFKEKNDKLIQEKISLQQQINSFDEKLRFISQVQREIAQKQEEEEELEKEINQMRSEYNKKVNEVRSLMQQLQSHENDLCSLTQCNSFAYDSCNFASDEMN